VSESEDLRAQLDSTVLRMEENYRMVVLGRLTAGIVHEINTPIGAIFSNNDVIRKSCHKVFEQLSDPALNVPANVLKTIKVIESLLDVDRMACERIATIIRGLKTYARVDESELREVDLGELIGNTIKLVQSECKRRVTLETHFADLEPVQCYPALVSQVIMNLMMNAVQAIDQEGTITVRTSLEDGDALIEITDTGKGIPLEHQTRIFTAGFTTKAIGVGTGLGLNIARRIIVENHRGRIWFKSDPGKGTTFFIRLPLKQPASSKEISA
jgi:two-component system NtrC family sensor kinase